VSLYRRRRTWWSELRLRGWPRIRVSTGTGVKGIARELEGTLKAIVAAGRRDLVDQIVDRRLTLADVHDLYHRDRDALEQKVQREASPDLGPLVDEWLGWLERPEALSPKTRAPYSKNTIRRYQVSWERILEAAPEGRAMKLQGLTRGFFLDLRAARIKAGATGVTVNRDFVAVAAFLRWCGDVQQVSVPAINLPRERENAGRERWLSADELAQLYVELPREWVPMFKLLAETGLRLGEAVLAAHKRGTGGLRWQDIRFAERAIIVRGGGVETTKGHKRRVPMNEGLARVLAQHRESVPAGPQEYVFRAPFTYQAAERIFARAVRRLTWPHTVVHDLRHTFGVHAVMAGVALPRLQKILGHKTPAMTLRYAQHAPEPHAQDDAAKIAASMAGAADREAKAVRDLLKVVDA
jgi:integrase